jgi:hypothetical protein
MPSARVRLKTRTRSRVVKVERRADDLETLANEAAED